MLLWIDLETTGLDPAKDAILEVALVVTDNELDEASMPCGECSEHVTEPAVFSSVIGFDRGAHPNAIDPYVLKMHTKNDLWQACESAAGDDDYALASVEEKLLALARRFCEAKTTPICGSTIAFDRAFLKVHMPRIEAHFSHRNLDVSVLGELASRWAPEVWAKRPRPGADAHRALADVRGSIELLKYWRSTILHEDLRGR